MPCVVAVCARVSGGFVVLLARANTPPGSTSKHHKSKTHAAHGFHFKYAGTLTCDILRSDVGSSRARALHHDTRARRALNKTQLQCAQHGLCQEASRGTPKVHLKRHDVPRGKLDQRRRGTMCPEKHQRSVPRDMKCPDGHKVSRPRGTRRPEHHYQSVANGSNSGKKKRSGEEAPGAPRNA